MSYGHATNLKSQIALLHDLCDRFVIGQSPFDIEKIWQAMYGTVHDYRHPELDSTRGSAQAIRVVADGDGVTPSNGHFWQQVLTRDEALRVAEALVHSSPSPARTGARPR